MDIYKEQEIDALVTGKSVTKKGNHHAYDIQPMGLSPIRIYQGMNDERDPNNNDSELQVGAKVRLGVKFVALKPDTDNFGEMMYAMKTRIIAAKQAPTAKAA